jgi:hypothetical protein
VDWAHDLKDFRNFTTSKGIGPGGELRWRGEGGDEMEIVFLGGLEKKERGTVEERP